MASGPHFDGSMSTEKYCYACNADSDASTRGHMSVVALSELLGASVRDASGAVRGRVREIAIAPQDHPTRIAFLIVKTAGGERMLPPDAITSAGATVRAADRGRAVGALHPVRRPAAAQARPARPANHRHPRPQGRPRQRRRARVDAGQQPPADQRRRRRRRRPRRRPPALEGHRAVVHAARAARAHSAAGDPVAVRRSARNRSGAARQAEDRLQGAGAAAPGGHRRHRRGSRRRPSASRCSRRSTRKSRPRRSRRSIPTSRCRSSSRSTRIAPPTSSRRWIPTPPPTCSATSRRSTPTKSSRRCSPRSGTRSRSCSSSASAPPPAA